MPALPETLPRRGIALPLAGWPLALLLATYILPGLIGHDPWKMEDATAFGVAFDMLQRGSWLTPSLAGEAFPDAPLFYWIAAAFGMAFSWLLPLPDAMRLASGACTLLILWLAYLAARELHGREHALAAPLILAGCIGFLVPAHDTQPMLLCLAAYFAIFTALALAGRAPGRARTIFGSALGVGMLANGPLAMLPALLLAAGAIALSENRRRALGVVASAVVLAALLTLAWLLPLKLQAPAYLGLWWQSESRQWSSLGVAAQTLFDLLKLLPWYAWPALPLAGWTLWTKRRTLGTPALALPILGFVAILGCIAFSLQARNVQALLLLPPLTLLAVPGVASLRRGAASALDWFGMMTFCFFGGFVWVGWCAMLFGWPERLARQVVRLQPGFVGSFSLFPVFIALLATLAWLWLIVRSPRSPFRGVTHWAAGVALLWLLAISLWLPWIERGKTYRPVARSLATALPGQHGCLARSGLGPAQRASLDYFEGITTRPLESAEGQECDWLLTQGAARRDEVSPGKQWRKVWEGNRIGDRSERFRLYRRTALTSPTAGDV